MTVEILRGAAAAARADEFAAIHGRAFSAIGARGWSPTEIAELLNRGTAFAAATAGGFLLADIIGDEAEILTFAVNPPLQRKGLGRVLLDSAIFSICVHDVKRCFLEVAEDNRAALSLYHAAQFQRVSTRPAYYHGEGAAIDAIIMERLLKD